jgi:hypothetical protein
LQTLMDDQPQLIPLATNFSPPEYGQRLTKSPGGEGERARPNTGGFYPGG